MHSAAMIESEPVGPRLIEPLIEYTSGCCEGGKATLPEGGPHPLV